MKIFAPAAGYFKAFPSCIKPSILNFFAPAAGYFNPFPFVYRIFNIKITSTVGCFDAFPLA